MESGSLKRHISKGEYVCRRCGAKIMSGETVYYQDVFLGSLNKVCDKCFKAIQIGKDPNRNKMNSNQKRIDEYGK